MDRRAVAVPDAGAGDSTGRPRRAGGVTKGTAGGGGSRYGAAGIGHGRDDSIMADRWEEQFERLLQAFHQARDEVRENPRDVGAGERFHEAVKALEEFATHHLQSLRER